MSTFKLTIENFEGPIDALLQLIEKRKMPINDISLSTIADEYIKFVQGLGNESLSSKTHFIYIASTLTLIKSKSLLPRLELTNEEVGDIELLKQRIAIFQEFKKGAEEIKGIITQQRRFFYPRPQKREISFQPHECIQTSILHESILSIFKEQPEKALTQKEATIRIAVHIDEMMNSLEDRITKIMKTDFNSFIGDHVDEDTNPKEARVYKVVGFLAMLELVKNGALQVLQKKNFSTIEIETA